MIGAETQYRALVRVLPPWYHAERGDEIVDTLLDLHDERARAALWTELLALLALGVRTRLAGRAAPARTVALGDLTRVGVLLGLLWGVLKSAGTLAHDRASWRGPAPAHAHRTEVRTDQGPHPAGGRPAPARTAGGRVAPRGADRRRGRTVADR